MNRASSCVVLVLAGALIPHGLLAQALAGNRAILEGLGAHYSLKVEAVAPSFPIKLTSGEISGTPAPNVELDRYIPILVKEFSLYPKELVAKLGLKRIVLCENLAFAGQLRAAVPDWEHDTLYLDTSRGKSNRMYQVRVLHHELYHMIDYKDDGEVYRDKEWSALNAEGFKYGTGGALAQNTAGTGVATDQYPGFINHYGTTGVEEDKAEVFAYMVAEASYLDTRIASDTVLRSKVNRMKALMSKFCAQVGPEFWQKASGLSRKVAAHSRTKTS